VTTVVFASTSNPTLKTLVSQSCFIHSDYDHKVVLASTSNPTLKKLVNQSRFNHSDFYHKVVFDSTSDPTLKTLVSQSCFIDSDFDRKFVFGLPVIQPWKRWLANHASFIVTSTARLSSLQPVIAPTLKSLFSQSHIDLNQTTALDFNKSQSVSTRQSPLVE